MFSSINKTLTLLSLMLVVMFGSGCDSHAELVNLGRWNETKLAHLISSAKDTDNPGKSVVVLSSYFKNTPYADHTLVGGPVEPEQLVINLAAFDCFTFLDVIESLRRSSDIEGFTEQLKSVRYSDGVVSYASRRHFFSDWVAEGGKIEDVTAKVGKKQSVLVNKNLNRKSHNSLWLEGLGVTPRKIQYIPSKKVDAEILSSLRPGDYVGIYSDLPGLDVSHTGLIVADRGTTVLLRHASSRKGVRRVIDEDLMGYLQGKPGLVVYRVKP